jgi:hypothetical protein
MVNGETSNREQVEEHLTPEWPSYPVFSLFLRKPVLTCILVIFLIRLGHSGAFRLIDQQTMIA